MPESHLVVKFVPADQSRGTLAHWAYWFEWEEADGTPVRQKYLSTVPLEVAETIVTASTAGLRARVDAAEKKTEKIKSEAKQLLDEAGMLLDEAKKLMDKKDQRIKELENQLNTALRSEGK